jgi:hypothetical protein
MGNTGTPTITPTATATNSGSPTATPTYALESVSETGSGFVSLHNESLPQPSVVETEQATATATPSYTGNVSVTDTYPIPNTVESFSGSASSSQVSNADGTSISVDATANLMSDISGCVTALVPCTEFNQGIADFTAVFQITNATNYMLSGTAMASASDATNFSGLASVSITSMTTMMQFVNIQASPGNSIPISMDVMLPPDLYEFNVQVFADTLSAVSASGTSSATCNVTFSP